MFKQIVLASLGLAAAALVALPASAQTGVVPSGTYVSGSVSWLSPQDVDFDDAGVTGELEFDDGWAGNIAFGYQWANGFRAEIEGGFGRVGFDTLEIDGLGSAGLDGDLDLWTLTLNAFYEFRITNLLRPYVGAGAGIAHQRVDDVTFTAGGVTTTLEGDDETDLMALGEVGLAST